MTQKVVDLRAFAKLAGLEYSTMRKYHQRAAQRRAEVAAGTADSVAVVAESWMVPENPSGRPSAARRPSSLTT